MLEEKNNPDYHVALYTYFGHGVRAPRTSGGQPKPYGEDMSLGAKLLKAEEM